MACWHHEARRAATPPPPGNCPNAERLKDFPCDWQSSWPRSNMVFQIVGTRRLTTDHNYEGHEKLSAAGISCLASSSEAEDWNRRYWVQHLASRLKDVH